MPSRASLGLCRLLMSISTWYIHDISCACPLVIDPGVVTAARPEARVCDACLPTALSSVKVRRWLGREIVGSADTAESEVRSGGLTRFVRSFVGQLICMRFTLRVASLHVYRMYCATSMTMSVSRMFVRRESKASKAHSSHKNRWDRFGEQLHLGHQPEPRLVALIYF